MTTVEIIDLQLSELEALQSIYPNDNEVLVQNNHELHVMKQFVETNGASYHPENRLHIALNLNLNESNTKLTVECFLPPDYPNFSLPEIFVRYVS